jgi:hypothetical protein
MHKKKYPTPWNTVTWTGSLWKGQLKANPSLLKNQRREATPMGLKATKRATKEA